MVDEHSCHMWYGCLPIPRRRSFPPQIMVTFSTYQQRLSLFVRGDRAAPIYIHCSITFSFPSKIPLKSQLTANACFSAISFVRRLIFASGSSIEPATPRSSASASDLAHFQGIFERAVRASSCRTSVRACWLCCHRGYDPAVTHSIPSLINAPSINQAWCCDAGSCCEQSSRCGRR